MDVGLRLIAQREQRVMFGVETLTVLNLGKNYFLHKRMIRETFTGCYIPPKETLEQIPTLEAVDLLNELTITETDGKESNHYQITEEDTQETS